MTITKTQIESAQAGEPGDDPQSGSNGNEEQFPGAGFPLGTGSGKFPEDDQEGARAPGTL